MLLVALLQHPLKDSCADVEDAAEARAGVTGLRTVLPLFHQLHQTPGDNGILVTTGGEWVKSTQHLLSL